ncbi:MAG: sulfotransferase [Candidatus Sedimenticola sp. (ex Thyasira tokunagai)]
MTTDKKTIYFVAGLPRSGSTLLMNILGQNPEFYVTPTSGILDLLSQVKNNWDKNDANQARERNENELIKKNVLSGMLQGYFSHIDQQVCIDKNRYWLEYAEMTAALLGGRENVRILVTVRDLRDVAASFEHLYRKTSALSQVPLETQNQVKCKTALGRFEMFIDDAQPIGRAFNAIRDAITRGWGANMHVVDYDRLTAQPAAVMAGIYQFLGQPAWQHEFDHVEQITWEDDAAYGFKDLHVIRTKVEPQKPRWPTIFDVTVTESDAWKNIERFARFWEQ